jgi:dihydropteroate synthase
VFAKLAFGANELDFLDPKIMGILNVTPDSFSDGGQLFRNRKVDLDALLNRAELMVQSGADILDVGGESTRPGAEPVLESEELERVLTAVEALCARFDTIISVDTSTPSVMLEASRFRIGLFNDVRAFQRQEALQVVAGTNLPICIMHMRGDPKTMQVSPFYKDIVLEISNFFKERLSACELAGISADRVILDPGFGFGKTTKHNFELLHRLREFSVFSKPVLVGLSRKAMIASVLDGLPSDRVAASAALALMAVERGANIVRVHDVKTTAEVLAMYKALPRDKI